MIFLDVIEAVYLDGRDPNTLLTDLDGAELSRVQILALVAVAQEIRTLRQLQAEAIPSAIAFRR